MVLKLPHINTHMCAVVNVHLMSVCVSTGSTSEDQEVMKVSEEEEERKDEEDVSVSTLLYVAEAEIM